MFRLPLVLACAMLGITLAVEMAYSQGGGAAPSVGPGGAADQKRMTPPRPQMPSIFDMFSLLRLPGVQKELDLSDEQKQNVQGLQNQAMRGQEGLAEILTPKQVKRLKELCLQARGAAALAIPQLAKELGLTPEQQEKFDELQQQAWAGRRQAFPQDLATLSPEQRAERIAEMRKQLQKIDQEFAEGAFGLLTPEQRQKSDKMIGKKVDPDLLQPPRPQPPGTKKKAS